LARSIGDSDEPHTKRVIDAYRTALRDATPSELLAAIATDYMYRRNTSRVAELQARQARAPVSTREAIRTSGAASR
jgi:para-nitrobenzyl esterase